MNIRTARRPGTWRSVLVACAAIACLVSAPATAQGPDYSRVVVFGDSLSDVGNTHHNAFLSIFAPQAQPPYFDGRFSNGLVWAEHLANGFDLDASIRSGEGGFNFAEGGALSGGGTNFLGAIDNVGRQVDNYLDDFNPSGDELFLIWGGGNDFIEIGGSLGSLFSGGGSPQGVANDLTGYIQEIANAGGRNFLVLNMPDLGAIPRYAGSNEQQDLSNTSAQFNALLDSQVDALGAQHPQLDIDLLDIESLFGQMLADPSLYGFTNTTDAAYNEGNGNVVSGAATYAFWDEIHPTSLAHQWIATAAHVALLEQGDMDGDGSVGVGDMDIVLARWGDTVTPFDVAAGDWNGDGTVGQADLDVVLGNFGGGVPPGANVPEPGALALLLFAGLAIGRRRNCRAYR